ncbi:hypothetical protein BKA69DRAFT_72833 [Paraphysoderma sedebokerense]|nr:hypothetical protein BKA69DRAFT_72833 [Paraphysoderma sedebokerense]
MGRMKFNSSCDNHDGCLNWVMPVMTGQEAVERLREVRPGSIETDQQEQFVSTCVDYAWARLHKCNQSGPVREVSTDSPAEDGLLCFGKPDSVPSFLILMGLPGSAIGKSWFANSLVQLSSTMSSTHKFVSINQDVLGSRSSVEDALYSESRYLSPDRTVVLDRCNPTREDRKYFIELMFNPKSCGCVYFTPSEATCKHRVKNRRGHPTIQENSKRGESTVKHFAKAIEEPHLNEGFQSMWFVKSFNDATELISRWTGVDAGNVETGDISRDNEIETLDRTILYKFPRTRHLFDAGGSGVSRDDLVIADDDFVHAIVKPLCETSKTSVQLVLEEKIDGANLGISIDPQTKEFRVQNRSHFVFSNTHVQFSQLNSWLSQNCSDLFYILTGTYSPTSQCSTNRILFGEWCFAKHSIKYTNLPDLFLAFDIFDVANSKFLSRAKFHSILSNTRIATVPSLPDIDFESLKSKRGWTELFKRRSVFADNYLEGIYIRADEGEWLRDRFKLVRPDFLASSQHWSTGTLEKNIVDYEWKTEREMLLHHDCSWDWVV